MLGTAIAAVAWAARNAIPADWAYRAKLLVYGIHVDRAQQVVTRDGVTLRGTVYMPRGAKDKLATILIRLPYGRDAYGEALGAAIFFARHGYAVLVQDVRGTFASGGQFVPWASATNDGVDTVNWIIKQPWSNQKVGTWGCSALGELQYALARARHPAHAAMAPMGAGGAAGSVGGRYAYFGVYEGGILQLASAFGWLVKHGNLDPRAPPLATPIDDGSILQALPVSEMVARVRPSANAWDQFVLTALDDPSWQRLDYVADGDTLATPTLEINTWGDQTLDGTLSLAEAARRWSPSTPHHLIIAPGNHCEQSAGISAFGDVPVSGAERSWFDLHLRWFDWWLRGIGPGRPQLPAYEYFMLGENRWLQAAHWPPEQARDQRFYLDSDGHANGRAGDGRLVAAPATHDAVDTYLHDPLHPVPSRGGPLCCTGNPADRSGPVDQQDVETRDDVLVYSSAPLAQPLRIAGPVSLHIVVDTDADDTDFIARLVDVAPDGRALGLQEGALRLRYRDGIAHPRRAQIGERYAIDVPMRSIAYRVPAGHRLRLHVASSSFPRLERNLGGAGANLQAVDAVVAHNRVHHGPGFASYLRIAVLPLFDASAHDSLRP